MISEETRIALGANREFQTNVHQAICPASEKESWRFLRNSLIESTDHLNQATYTEVELAIGRIT